MKKKVLWTAIVLVVCFVVVLVVCIKVNIPTIDKDEVVRVYYGGWEGKGKRELDIDEFLNYYNDIYDIEKSKYGSVTTPPSDITIELENGKYIRISYQTTKFFLISFEDDDGQWKTYFGKQKEIHNMLTHGEYEIEE